MTETIDIIAKKIIDKRYKDVKNTDFNKKQEKTAIMHIIMRNSDRLNEVTSSYDLIADYDYMKIYLNDAFQIVELAKRIISENNIPKKISIFSDIEKEVTNIDEIIEKMIKLSTQ